MQIARLVIPTSSLNHTALFVPSDTFKRQYYTLPQKFGKDKESREHDEVLSRGIKHMGLHICFAVVHQGKKNEQRVAIIYGKIRKESDRSSIVNSLQTILKKYLRYPDKETYTIEYVGFKDYQKIGDFI